MRLDWEPQLGELQDDVSVGLQNSCKFAKKRNGICNVFHERDGHNDADTSVPEGQEFRPSLDSRDGRLYEAKQIVAIRVYPDDMVDSAQENGNSTRPASEVDYKSPFAKRRPREIPNQGRVAIVPGVVESERVEDFDNAEIKSLDCISA